MLYICEIARTASVARWGVAIDDYIPATLKLGAWNLRVAIYSLQTARCGEARPVGVNLSHSECKRLCEIGINGKVCDFILRTETYRPRTGFSCAHRKPQKLFPKPHFRRLRITTDARGEFGGRCQLWLLPIDCNVHSPSPPYISLRRQGRCS